MIEYCVDYNFLSSEFLEVRIWGYGKGNNRRNHARIEGRGGELVSISKAANFRLFYCPFVDSCWCILAGLSMRALGQVYRAD